MRPWLDWRTLETPGYRLHHRPEFEHWTRHIATRIESVDSALLRRIGYSPPKPVHIVVDDPFQTSNGYAIPFLDRPVSVWWATPPDPRNDIGNYRVWSEALAVHELAHLAHMTRPSRNPFRRGVIGPLLDFGPITLHSPRWVYEGYATLIEGEITGTGRPNNVWRPAILRQWAIEGRLPTYGQLSAWGDFNGGEFAYLGGSAFLEWLSARSNDSSLVHVWRRLTARQARGFDASFTGVFGEPASVLYGRHVAELTRDAMAAKADLERAGLVEGELVQHLSWNTGDPAVSPNGERVVIALRERNRPGRLVVWKAAPEPEDTTEARRRLAALRRDPQDVPERRVYPRPRRAEKTLLAVNGRSFQMPRWFADNRRVLVTRWTARTDGTLSPALSIWDTESGSVRRVTEPVGVLNADPHPNGTEAVAMQCHWGHCDVAHVDLNRGVMRTLLEGNERTTYYRPRYSPDGSRVLASVSQDGRWRVMVTDSRGRGMRYVDPDDGANRYDAQWLGNDSIVVVSERGGVPNLELLALTAGTTRSLTRVTGAAVGVDVNQRDGSLWYLSMHSRGLDVRRLDRGAHVADSVITVSAERFGFARSRGSRAGVTLSSSPVGPSRLYGAGPHSYRWLPGAFASADGIGGVLTIFTSDLVGRLSAAVTGAFGEPGTWQGGSLDLTWRRWRPSLDLGAVGVIDEPSRGRDPQPAADSIDATLTQGLIALSAERRGEGWRVRGRIGGAGGRLSPELGESDLRAIGFGEAELFLQQSRGASALTERLRVHFTQGSTGSTYQRAIASLDVASGGLDVFPLELSGRAGRITGSAIPFERFSVGGASSPVGDSSLFSQRFQLPMYPAAVLSGRAFLAWRAALPAFVLTPFYESVGVGDELDGDLAWVRAVGLERRFSFGPMPPAFLPRADIRGGVGYTLDEPFRKKVRAYLEMRFVP